MRFLDAGLSLALGLILAARPQAFFKPHGPEAELARRRSYLRKLGYLLMAAGLLLVLAAIRRP